MKKIISMAITMMLMSTAVTSLSVSAETLTEDGSSSHDVYATYNPLADADIIYKVDVEWGSMEFTYQAGDITKTWNPETHSYEETKTTEDKWVCASGANSVKVTNSSNTAIQADVTAEINDTYRNDISVSVEGGSINLGDASVNATTETAGSSTSGTATVNLSGTLSKDVTTSTTIGSVTVSLSVPASENE